MRPRLRVAPVLEFSASPVRRVNTPYTRHVRLWTWAGWSPLTPTEYRYPLEARATWLLSGNVEECEWTTERLEAIERIEGYITAHRMAQAEFAAFELTREIRPTTEPTWNPE